jgi:hypothetical protein
VIRQGLTRHDTKDLWSILVYCKVYEKGLRFMIFGREKPKRVLLSVRIPLVEGIIQTEKRFVRDAGDLSVLSFFLKQKGSVGSSVRHLTVKTDCAGKSCCRRKRVLGTCTYSLSLSLTCKSRFHMAWKVKGEIQRTGKIKSEREEEFGGAPFGESGLSSLLAFRVVF